MDVREREERGYRPGYEAVAERLIEFIEREGLQAGERLPTEQELGRQLGVSRAMVREAIKVLSAKGHVRTRRGSGIFVGDRSSQYAQATIDLSMQVDYEHMLELFEFRSMQEMWTARLAAGRITFAEVKNLEQLVEVNRRGAEAGQWEIFIESDAAFHQGIAKAARNTFLIETIASTFRLQRWAINMMIGGAPGSLLVSAEQHAVVLEALKAGEAEVAAEAMRAHVMTVCEDYQREMRRLVAAHTKQG